MSVYDNVMTGAFLRRDKNEIDKDLKRSFEYFPFLKMKRRQQARSLSGGEQQMLAFARALLAHPRLFLFDEPSLGLAPIMVDQVADHIKQLSEEGYAIILVEQNAKMALKIADYGYIMEAGRIVLEGSSKDLTENKDVQELYLGIGQENTSSTGFRLYKKRRTW